MKLGLDIHGVIDSNPGIFSFLSKIVIESEGEVHIITGGTWNEDLKNLVEESGIVYTHSFSVYDHLKSIGAEKMGRIKFPDGTTQKKFDNDLWDSIKGEYCQKNKIDLHIDDTEIYSKYFTTPFLLFKSGDDLQKLSHIDIRNLM
jgi:hypothetical protein